MLSVQNLSFHFKNVLALNQVSFEIAPGTITGIIGQNGAGKSTLLNCISRIYRASQGQIYFEGQSLLNKMPHTLARLGIARTFQRAALFSKMTVLDNIMVGLHSRTLSNFISSALKLPSSSKEEREGLIQVKKLLTEYCLEAWQDKEAAALPVAVQKRVELLRALISSPKLLLLDEPASGLNHAERQNLKSCLYQLRKQHISILMVEHNLDLIMQISDRIIVLDFGNKIAEGTPETIQNDSIVANAFLGRNI